MIPVKIPRENKQQLLVELQQYFEDECLQSIGNLEAEGLLDFIMKQITPYVYNQAILDARQVVMLQMERADEELSFLVKPLEPRRY